VACPGRAQVIKVTQQGAELVWCRTADFDWSVLDGVHIGAPGEYD